jgi:CDP-glycerol glycerophosphotransferase (TagB/SpsB family)
MKRKYLFFISQDYSYPILRPLEDEIKKRGDEVRWFLYGNEIDYDKLRDDEKRVFSVDEIKSYNPDAVFVPGNVVPSFIPGYKIKLFHGLPSKKSKNGVIFHFTIRGMFDLYCTESPYSTQRFVELEKKHKNFCVKETGWCKLDPLFENITNKDEKSKKQIFFASTFSPRFTKAAFLYPIIKELVEKGDYNWHITLHPKMNQKTKQLYMNLCKKSKNAIYIDPVDIISSLKSSNLMICDTSSIMYEFLVQLKPVIAFQTHVKEPYLYLVDDKDKIEDSIYEIFQYGAKKIDKYKNEIEAIYPYTNPNSSKRVLDATENMIYGKLCTRKTKPLNLIRNFKLRKELNYWKFW